MKQSDQGRQEERHYRENNDQLNYSEPASQDFLAPKSQQPPLAQSPRAPWSDSQPSALSRLERQRYEQKIASQEQR